MDIDTYGNLSEINDSERSVLASNYSGDRKSAPHIELFDIDHWVLLRENLDKGVYERPVKEGERLIGWQEVSDIPPERIHRQRLEDGHEHTLKSAEEFLRQKKGIENGFELLDQ
jgi:hypothetical protein